MMAASQSCNPIMDMVTIFATHLSGSSVLLTSRSEFYYLSKVRALKCECPSWVHEAFPGPAGIEGVVYPLLQGSPPLWMPNKGVRSTAVNNDYDKSKSF
jgi:hypothetical protein